MAGEIGPGSSMTKAVQNMEDMFRSTHSELNNLERKFDREFAHAFDDGDAVSDDLRNPVKVKRRLNEVKSDFSKIKEEVKEIQKLQAETLNAVRQEFEKMLMGLSALENKTLQNQESSEASFDQEQQLAALISHMAEKSANKSKADNSSSHQNTEKDTTE